MSVLKTKDRTFVELDEVFEKVKARAFNEYETHRFGGAERDADNF